LRRRDEDHDVVSPRFGVATKPRAGERDMGSETKLVDEEPVANLKPALVLLLRDSVIA
jgi:hypothetical protein